MTAVGGENYFVLDVPQNGTKLSALLIFCKCRLLSGCTWANFACSVLPFSLCLAFLRVLCIPRHRRALFGVAAAKKGGRGECGRNCESHGSAIPHP